MSATQHHDIIPQVEAPAKAILLPPHKIKVHHPNAGLNPLVDPANYIFSILGKLKATETYTHLNKLHQELAQEIDLFYSAIQHQGQTEMASICRYLLCATIDDVITHTAWGSEGRWEVHSLLAASQQETQHQERFFAILDRAIKDPNHYIDLMEFLYLCLSIGYKGKYRKTEHSQFQLEQITNNLYKHIRACRGDFSKSLSPVPIKKRRLHSRIKNNRISLMLVTLLSASIIMSLFICLGYLMDIISNETFKTLAPDQKSSPIVLSRKT